MPTDPRLAGARPTTAEQLLDRAIRHGTYLERFKAHEVRKILTVLEKEVVPDLAEQISGRLAGIAARGYDRGPATTARLQEMKAAIEAVLARHGRTMQGVLGRDLTALAQHEAGWQRRALQQAVPVDVTFRLPSSGTLATLVSGHPVQGAVLEDWFGRMEAATASRVVSDLTIGVAEGQTIQQMVRRIDGTLDATRTGVETTVRSFITGVSARTREDLARENEDILDGVRWVSTLDDRACVRCLAMDGKVFPINEGPRPPLHPNCHCGIVPKVKSLKALAEAAGFQVGKLPPGKRAAMGGPIARTTTAEEWLSGLKAFEQDDILGKAKGPAFRRGDLSLREMLDQSGRPLTLEQLIEKDLLDAPN